ncbi:hypothetical protein NUSPORA_01959 [Nucleospora cyclopteri]
MVQRNITRLLKLVSFNKLIYKNAFRPIMSERKRLKKTDDGFSINEPIFDSQQVEYSSKDVLDVINKYKKDSLNFVIGDVNLHCNKSFRMTNDNWYSWNDSLIKSLNTNKEKMKNLLLKNGHEKITNICRIEGGEMWNNELFLDLNEGLGKVLKKYLFNFEKKIKKGNFFTRWCVLKQKTALQLAVERLNISNNNKQTLAEIKDFILDSKDKYYSHKKEKYDIINEYYNN